MKKDKNKIYSSILLLAALVFYLFFAFFDGAVICVDTPSYVEMSIMREFVYPLLLAVFRAIFGEQYLLMVVVLQSILAAIAAWNVSIYCKKQFSLGYGLSTLIFLIPIGVSLLNRFAAGRGSMYSNSILTEGLTLSLFLLFFRYLHDYLVNRGKRALWMAIILTGVMVATRKQMYVALFLLFIVLIYVGISSVKENNTHIVVKDWGKTLGRAVIICVAIVLSASLLDHTYNYVLRGRFVGHSSDNRFVLTMVFYTAEEEYVEELPEELQPLFLEIYENCDRQGYLMHSAGEGWYNNVVHFGDYYDLIQIKNMWPAIQSYVAEHYTTDPTERELITDDITNVMISSLMDKTAPSILKVLFNNFLSGLVTTVAQRNHILIWYSLFAYIGYIALTGVYAYKVRRLDSVLLLCILTLLSIVVNVGLVSAVIFCQTRYTVYNMPLFYISGLILLKSIWDVVKKKNASSI